MFQATLFLFCTLFCSALSTGGFKAPFGCQGQAVGDLTRTNVLDFINFIRSQLAVGNYEIYNISSARYMKKLRWDCNLEAIAERAVRNCSENATLPVERKAMNFNYYGPYIAEEVRKNPIDAAVWDWIAVRDQGWPADNIYNGNSKLRRFANMIRACTGAVGCYSYGCNERASSACVFSQPEVRVGTLVYRSGPPCKNGDKCINSKRASCENGLCAVG